MSSKARKLIKGSATRTSAFFINALVALLVMPIIVKSLGNEMYGLWIIIASLFGFYWIFEFGLSTAVQRYLPRAMGKEDYREANAIINTSLFIFSLLALLTFVLSCIIVYISPLLIKNLPYANIIKKVIVILGLRFSIGLLKLVFDGILVSHLRYDLKNYVDISMLLIRNFLIVIFLKMGYGILALAFISLFTTIISSLIIAIITKHIARYLVFSKNFIDKSKMRTLFGYSFFVFIRTVIYRFNANIPNFIIAAFLGLNFVTLYSIASRLIRYFKDLIHSTTGMFIPVFSQYDGKGDYVSIREKFIITTKASTYLSIFVGGTLIIFGKAFINRWMGEEYLSAYPVLVVLSIATIAGLTQKQSVSVLLGISKQRFITISNLVQTVINVIAILVLVRTFGLIGVALGILITSIFFNLFINPIYTCRVIKLDIAKYYFDVIIPVFLKSTATLIVIWFIFRGFIKPNYLNLFFLAFDSLILFLSAVFFIGLNNKERCYFKRVVFGN